jgi:hypothetical protein
MTPEQALLEKIKVLPPNLKQEAVDFVDFLQSRLKAKNSKPKRIEGVSEVRLREQKKAFDEAFGIWADRDPKEVDRVMREIRRKNNGRD